MSFWATSSTFIFDLDLQNKQHNGYLPQQKDAYLRREYALLFLFI